MSNSRKSGDFNLDEELRSNIAANEEGTPISDDHEDEKVVQEKIIEDLAEGKISSKDQDNIALYQREVEAEYESKLAELKAKGASEEELASLKDEYDLRKTLYKLSEDERKYEVNKQKLTKELNIKIEKLKKEIVAHQNKAKEIKLEIKKITNEFNTKVNELKKETKTESDKAKELESKIQKITDEFNAKAEELKKEATTHLDKVKELKLEIKNLKVSTKEAIKHFNMTEDEIRYNISRKLKRRPELMNSDVLLSVRNLKQFFFFGSGLNKTKLKAVSNVSFDVHHGECFGIVGESGCGKTTTGRSIIKLYDITSGSIYYKGYRISAGNRWNRKEIKYTRIRMKQKLKDLEYNQAKEIALLDEASSQYQKNVSDIKARTEKEKEAVKAYSNNIIEVQKAKIKQIKYDDQHCPHKLVNEIQMIFQDPVDSLDPRMTVEDIIQEGLKIQGHTNREENHKKVVEMLEKVGLVADHASRYPHEFSGGQRQRIGIARALVMNPKLLICDEPISALDVSIRAQIINLLNDLKDELGLTIIFIAHDLSVVKYFCDRIAVMYFGKIVELASSDELFKNPLHPYTKSLLSAIPKPNPVTEKTRIRKVYNPNEVHDYSEFKPELKEIKPGHFIYCNDPEFEEYKKVLKD